jgi:poly-beta-1,6-N-acetyl-D-glucosamine synthase
VRYNTLIELLETHVAVTMDIDRLRKLQIKHIQTAGSSIDTPLKLLSLFVICCAFVFGSIDKDNQWSLPIFFIGCSYQIARMLFYFVGSIVWNNKLKKIPSISNNESLPLISIILPCYNEEKVIQQSLKSLLNIEYSNYEIIVVDDGSTDNTLKILRAMSLPASIKVMAQENAGKAMALNNGILSAEGEYILCVDADSILEPKSLLAGIRHFLFDPKVVAVAGSVRVSNKNHFITSYQDLEYGLGELQKHCLSNFGKVNIVPGPVGLFKKSAVLASGGYELVEKTFAEDTELTLRLLSEKHSVVFEPNMISYTEAPTDWLSLLRQRYRWTRGIYQAFRKNMMTLKTKNNYLFSKYLFLEKIWVPIMEFTLLAYFVGHFVKFANIDLFFIYTAVVFVIEIFLVTLSAYYANRSLLLNLIILLASRFSASIVISTWKYLALLEEWNEVQMTWDKLSREGLKNLKSETEEKATSEVVC